MVLALVSQIVFTYATPTRSRVRNVGAQVCVHAGTLAVCRRGGT